MDASLQVTLGVLAGVGALVALALALRAWSRVQVERLERLAARRGGRLLREPWHAYPRVEWNLGDGLLQASAVTESDENGGRGGTWFFAYVAGARLPDFDLELRRDTRPKDDWHVPPMRDPDFAQAFRMRTDDEARAAALLDRELRAALLEFDPRLKVALRLGEAPAYRGGVRHAKEKVRRLELSLAGLPADIGVLEDLVAAARLAYARCGGPRRRRAG
jgi:hypothetical protein